MSTVSTRQIGHKDRRDKVAIKQDAEALVSLAGNKWGVIEVVINSVTWTCSDALATVDAGTLDLRAAAFHGDCDTPIVDNLALTTNQGTVTLGAQTKYYFSVNNGVVGPAAALQGDSTWDLLTLSIELPEGNTINNFQATVNYTLSFTDLTPTTAASANDTKVLEVDEHKPSARAAITKAPTDFGTNNGRVEIKFVSLTAVGSKECRRDAPPAFQVAPAVTPSPTAMQGPVISHYVSANSGVKNYPLRGYMIFAINNGKVDGNGSNYAGLVWFVTADLWKPWDPRSKEQVSVTLGYSYLFTAM